MENKQQNLSIAALVLGILSIIASWGTSILGLILGIIGIVIAKKAKREETPNSLMTGGLVCSIIGIAISVVRFVIVVLVVGLWAATVGAMM